MGWEVFEYWVLRIDKDDRSIAGNPPLESFILYNSEVELGCTFFKV